MPLHARFDDTMSYSWAQKHPSPKITLISGFHYRANVLLAITNYAVMKRLFQPCSHDRENSVFLPVEQLGKTSGGLVRRHCRSCKLPVYMPKRNQISAPLRFVHPNCSSPLPARPLRCLPNWLNITLAICIRLLIGAVGFQLKPTSLVTLKVVFAKTQTMAIDIPNAIQSWVRSL